MIPVVKPLTISAHLVVLIIYSLYLEIKPSNDKTPIMSFDEHDNGVYLTCPNDLEQRRMVNFNTKTETGSETIEYKSYYLEDYPPFSEDNSIPDEYLLERPSKNVSRKNTSSDAQQPRPTKAIIEDIYDEDHYTLARPPGMSPHDNVRLSDSERAQEDNRTYSEKKAPSSCDGKKSIIGMIVAVLVIVVFLLTATQGAKRHLCIVIPLFI